jgi:hypothetical protein
MSILKGKDTANELIAGSTVFGPSEIREMICILF